MRATPSSRASGIVGATTTNKAASVERRRRSRGRFRVGPRLAAIAAASLLFLFSAFVGIAAAYVHYHSAYGYNHGLRDGFNNNGFLTNEIVGQYSGAKYATRYQSGIERGTISCFHCGDLGRSIYPSINECHESAVLSANDPELPNHAHYHQDFCG